MENGKELAQKPLTLKELLTRDDTKKRFQEMLGNKAAGYISSIVSATKSNAALAECEPNSILSAAVIAATLDLPIQNNLGFAALVPFNEKGQKLAQFMMMWRGYVQLAMRTGQYSTMNVCEVYEGELVKYDRFTGDFTFDESKKTTDKVIGYTAYFRMINGFEKRVYWTVEQIKAHGKRYSKSFANEWGQWNKNFDAMAKKTVLKMLLSKYGILSVDMQLQKAIMADQAAITEGAIDAEFDYVDNPENAPANPEAPIYDWESLRELLDLKRDSISLEELKNANRIVNGKEEKSYNKLQEFLKTK